jgi:hypothetical protein
MSGKRLRGNTTIGSSGLVLAIATINAWNRINATTRQITGEWLSQWISSSDGVAQTV